MENHGLYSARFLGEETPFEQKRKKVLEMMQNAKDNERGASFKCSICFIDEDGKIHLFEQEWNGKISNFERGENGFGYDPIFEYNGKTFAEMQQQEKNKISHRGKAIEDFMKYIEKNLEK